MRCPKCSWPNPANASTCSHCGAQLVAPENNENHGLSTIMEDTTIPNSYEKETVVPKSTIHEDSLICPKCGHPLEKGMQFCPKCSFDVSKYTGGDVHDNSDSKVASSSKDEGNLRRTRIINGDDDQPSRHTPSRPHRGTVNPYMMMEEEEKVFRLTPIKRQNERRELDPVEYDGERIVLTRDNTERGNLTITSQEQAVIEYVDGEWQITDKSEQRTTFVCATKTIPLHDGDIILLGNRLFQFNEL